MLNEEAEKKEKKRRKNSFNAHCGQIFSYITQNIKKECQNPDILFLHGKRFLNEGSSHNPIHEEDFGENNRLYPLRAYWEFSIAYIPATSISCHDRYP